jgi:Cysteine-rich CPXCG
MSNGDLAGQGGADGPGCALAGTDQDASARRADLSAQQACPSGAAQLGRCLFPGLEPRPLLGSGVGRELLPKSEVLEGERATRREDRAEDPDQKGHEKAHGAAILPQPRMLTIPRAYEVFADHAHKKEAIFSAGLLARDSRVGQAEAMVFQVERPFCGEPGVVEIEPADFEPGESVLVQDCEVCCRPWTVRVQRDPSGAIMVSADRD